jgi:TPR repeat protein
MRGCRFRHGWHMGNKRCERIRTVEIDLGDTRGQLYFISGAFSDSGVIASGGGRWQTRSNVTKQTADGTYTKSDTNHMLGTGPLGAASWTRVVDKGAAGSSGRAVSAQSSEGNPFENVFPETSAPPANVSQQLATDYDNALRKDKAARDRLEKSAQGGNSEAQVRFGMLLQKEGNAAEAIRWYGKAAQQGNVDGM